MVVASTAHAQFRLFNGIDEIEIAGGVSLVWLEDVKYENYNVSKIGYFGGVGLGWQICDKLDIDIKFQFQRKGINRLYDVRYFNEVTQDFQDGEIYESWNFNYFTISLPVSYYLDNKRKFYVGLGPFLSKLRKLQIETQYRYNGTHEVSSGLSNFKDIDFGVTVLLGHNLQLSGFLDINLGLFFDIGLIDISNYSNNTAFQIARTRSLGLSIALKKN